MTSSHVPSTQLVSWAAHIAAMAPLEPELYERRECENFLAMWIAACADAGPLLRSLGPLAESFVEVSQYSLMEVIWREDLPPYLSEEAVEGCPRMLAVLCELTDSTMVAGTFWMVIVRHWRATYRCDPNHPLLPSVKAAILEQLRNARDSQCLRESAWEGVRLIDEQLATAARSIEREHQ